MSLQESAVSLVSARWTTADEPVLITTDSTVIDGHANATTQTVLSTTHISECETFRADYGIVSGCVCALALVLGVIFCFFGW
jgi:hypothetical protein